MLSVEDVLTAILSPTAGKKISPHKAYKFSLKAEKLFWTLVSNKFFFLS